MEDFKVLCIGDPHIRESSTIETGILSDFIDSIIGDHDPDVVVVMGDTLHNHEKINCSVQVIAVKFFERIVEKLKPSAKLFVLIGNHDICDPYSFLPENHAFYSLKDKDQRLVIVDTPRVEKFGGYHFMFCPYVPDGRFREACAGFNFNEVSTLFCHQEFSGVKVEDFVSEAEDYSDAMPLCVAGHIHKYQVVADNLIYVGTPYQHRFGEDTDKALLMLTYKESEIIPERLRLEGVPLKIAHVVSCEEFHGVVATIDSFNRYKIEIFGYDNEIRSLKMTDEFLAVQKMQNVKVSVSIVSDRSKHLSEEKMKEIISLSFRERLENSLRELKNEKLNELHREISCVVVGK